MSDRKPEDEQAPTEGLSVPQESDAPIEPKELEPKKQYPEWTPSQKPHQPWMCRAHRTADGELCRKPAVRGGVCLFHGGSAPQVIEKHKRELEAKLPKASKALDELLSGDHAPSKLGAVREIHDRTIGPVRGTGNDVKQGVQVNIGFALGGLTPPIVEVISSTDAIDAETVSNNAEDEDS